MGLMPESQPATTAAFPFGDNPPTFLLTPALHPQRELTLQYLGVAHPLELDLGIQKNFPVPLSL